MQFHHCGTMWQIHLKKPAVCSPLTVSEEHEYCILRDVVDQLVERWPWDPMDSMTRGLNQVRGTIKKRLWEFFQVKMLCWLIDWLIDWLVGQSMCMCVMCYVGKCVCVQSFDLFVYTIIFLCVYKNRNVLYFIDAIYKRSACGKEFMRHCDLVHSFADDIINKRRQILVSVCLWVSPRIFYIHLACLGGLNQWREQYCWLNLMAWIDKGGNIAGLPWWLESVKGTILLGLPWWFESAKGAVVLA